MLDITNDYTMPLPANPKRGQIVATDGQPPNERIRLQRLRRTNLDLLPILHELLRTRSVTATAAALGVTQPAVSKALRQLRHEFRDDLLVSLGRDARLTERALLLQPPLARVLSDLGVLLEPAAEFDPAQEALRIVINTADYVSVLVAPELMRLCAQEAPKADIQFVERAFAGVDDMDSLDFTIAPRRFGAALGSRFERMPLWRDEMVCIAATGDNRFGEEISPAEFQGARHIVYQLGDRRADIATLIQPTAVLEVAPVCEVPNFLVMGAIVERAQCLALLPRMVAREIVRSRNVRILEIDFPDRALDIDAFWTPRAGSKRGHGWAQGLLARAATAVFSANPVLPRESAGRPA
jgi:DNA-binding transcriptional LysR family regulator